MPGFCTSIGFVFILGVELFDYVVDGGICDSLDGQAKWGIWPQDGEDQTLRVPPDLNLFNSKNGKNIFLVL